MQAMTQAVICEDSFGHSWTDTMQLSSVPSVPVSEPAAPSLLGVGVAKVRSLRECFTRSPRSSVSLHERIWGSGKITLSTWTRRAGQARFLADVGWRLAALLIVAFLAWSPGEGTGGVKGREYREWEQWRTYESVHDTAAQGDYFGRFFRAESDEDIAAWWQTLENQIHVPNTVEGGFI